LTNNQYHTCYYVAKMIMTITGGGAWSNKQGYGELFFYENNQNLSRVIKAFHGYVQRFIMLAMLLSYSW